MESASLGSILSAPEAAETPQAEPVQAEQQAETPAQPEPAREATGEVTATPAVQEDPIERHRKGLESAVLAERRKRQELEAQIAQLQQRQQVEKPAASGPPDPAQYTDIGTYSRDVARYEALQVVAEQQRQVQEQEQLRTQQAQVQQFQSRLNETVAKGQAEYADFDASINSGLAPFLNPVMQQALGMADDGHKVAYYLSKNPAEAARLSGLDPLRMVMEIGRLESKVAAPARPVIPQTLTQQRDSRGQFETAYAGPTPLDDILKLKR